MKAISLFLSILLICPASVQGQSGFHLVPIEDLKMEISEQVTKRSENIREIKTLLQNDLVLKRLGHLYDLEKVTAAIPMLDNETLARLAKRSSEANDQLRAGISTAGWVAIVIAVIVVVFWIVFAVVFTGASKEIAREVGS